MIEFDADIVKSGNITCIALPFNAKEAFGIQSGTIYVRGQANGCAYRGRLISRGGGRQIMTVDKALRNALGIQDETARVHFTMEIDTASEAPEQQAFRMPECAMNVLTAITTRRSIRRFLPVEVGEEAVDAMLNAACCAPSAKNKRPWHFVVIRDKRLMEEIASSGSGVRAAKEAGVCIAVCADKNVQGIMELLHADCAAATQNMLLCAHALGLGAVWCCTASGSDLYKMLIDKLGLPVKVLPFALVAAGIPGETREPLQRFERQKIHRERW